MNSYEFAVLQRRNGLLIRGHIGGDKPLPGVPELASMDTGTSDILVFRLVFRPAIQHRSTGLDHLITKPPSPLRMIRILLPDRQEFIIRSRHVRVPGHPVPRIVTEYLRPAQRNENGENE